MLKVSFDFDGTLTLPNVELFCKRLVDAGLEVWVTTMRHSDATLEALAHDARYTNHELYAVTDRLGIPRHRIQFTEEATKVPHLEGKGFVFHLDDNPEVLEELRTHVQSDTTHIVDVLHHSWHRRCKALVEKHI